MLCNQFKDKENAKEVSCALYKIISILIQNHIHEDTLKDYTNFHTAVTRHCTLRQILTMVSSLYYCSLML